MVNHDFPGTPLAVVDSAATKATDFSVHRYRFPAGTRSPDPPRLQAPPALVDNCLVSDRLDAPAFRLQLDRVPVMELIDDAVQLGTGRAAPSEAGDCGRPRLPGCDPTRYGSPCPTSWTTPGKTPRPEKSPYAPPGRTGRLELTVSDEGPGLAPELAQRIFELHERGERSDQTRGFGLGLWGARRVAQMHGGDVQVTPAAGGGTCFTLTRPAAFPKTAALPQLQHSPSPCVS
ncbi:[3-methyl-2-oxobutanoate dehydrogenase [lipoamide]] kinase, mitochondrial [Manis javanica]|nr:[3-methyl-2-oxobutanoate dehydrogenase [lipoamide]] kinase, mitochondrial [Manis javanica]